MDATHAERSLLLIKSRSEVRRTFPPKPLWTASPSVGAFRVRPAKLAGPAGKHRPPRGPCPTRRDARRCDVSRPGSHGTRLMARARARASMTSRLLSHR
eukprot:2939375-Prymnesium_polylepis.1